MTLLVAYPAFQDSKREDSFPLSTFPMFSRGKPDPGVVVTQVLGVFRDGTRKPLPPALATGNTEVIQALRMIRDAVQGGRKRSAAFCGDVARRVQQDESGTWDDVMVIEVARSHFDAVAYFETGPTPATRRTLERCLVKR